MERVAEHDVVRRNLIPTVKHKYLSIPRFTKAVCLAVGQVFMCMCVRKVNTTSRENGDSVMTLGPCSTSFQECQILSKLTRETYCFLHAGS